MGLRSEDVEVLWQADLPEMDVVEAPCFAVLHALECCNHALQMLIALNHLRVALKLERDHQPQADEIGIRFLRLLRTIRLLVRQSLLCRIRTVQLRLVERTIQWWLIGGTRLL